MSELPLKTPLFEEHVMLGAQMTEYAGWMLPLQHSSHAARNKVASVMVTQMPFVKDTSLTLRRV